PFHAGRARLPLPIHQTSEVTTMMPYSIETTTRSADMDVRALAYVLDRMHPDLSAPILPGESWEDMRARRAAAADILDDLLSEAAADLAEADAQEVSR
ncbi:hypothetical protein ACWEPC_05190, partial [Nonomuraea sp. NPDC004297]